MWLSFNRNAISEESFPEHLNPSRQKGDWLLRARQNVLVFLLEDPNCVSTPSKRKVSIFSTLKPKLTLLWVNVALCIVTEMQNSYLPTRWWQSVLSIQQAEITNYKAQPKGLDEKEKPGKDPGCWEEMCQQEGV